MEITIRQLDKTTDTILDDINLLLPMLSEGIIPLTQEGLLEIINSDNSALFVAEANKKIVGMLTLIFYRIPSGLKAIIEDVVVDEKMRGEGIGRILVAYAINQARIKEVDKIDLTSSPSRVIANLLYQKLGFSIRKTNVYRLKLNSF